MPSLPARLRGAARRAKAKLAPAPDPYLAYCAEVEPALAAEVRVHRFAAEVVTAPADAPAAAVEPMLAPSGPDALNGAGPDYVLLAGVGAGAELSPLALQRLGQAALLATDADLITCDWDLVDGGRRFDPHLLPGPSPDLLLATDSTAGVVCVRREAALAAGVPDGPAWRYELALTLAGPGGARHAHVPLVLVHLPEAPEPDPVAEAHAVTRVLDARGESPVVVETIQPRNTGSTHPVPLARSGRRRIRRRLSAQPHVEAIVLFRDKPDLLRRCAHALLERSTYPNLTLRLMDNGSEEPDTAKLVEDLAAHDRVRSQRDPGPFNFAALNNAAVRASDADVLVFLNNDTELITEPWVEDLLEEAQRPEVGAVAPLLLYPEGTVQHAGAALGIHGYAGHPFAGLRPDTPTPYGTAVDGTRNWLAVTAACLMVERSKFDAVGGFDESFVVAGNDVDLCLRLTDAGHRSLCVPHVEMLHDESQSRGAHIDPSDFQRSEERYGSFRTVGDPFYNPSLTLARSDCSLRAPGE